MEKLKAEEIEVPELKRNLKSRHLVMISLGGAIGTGLFLASGNALHTAGPGGALLAYAIIGIMVYFVMTSLAEMAAFMPVSGSFSTYATKFVDPAFGFAMGWNYWYNWAITVAAELVAAALIMQYWFKDAPPIIWSALFLGIIFLLNIMSVRGFGEAEYWFAMIKVVTVIVFLFTSFGIIFGVLGGGDPLGFENFTIADGPFHNGFMAMFGVFMIAGFSFQGTELLGVAAGESEDPEKNIPRAIRSVFWRILLFYILSIFVIALIIPFTTPSLASDTVATSPFTLVFEHIGVTFAASAMNAIILTSVLSAGNSGMYASTRMLWTLAVEGKAPKFLAKVNSRGIPINALLATTLVGSIAFLTALTGGGLGEGAVYGWLLAASGMSGFIVWVGIAITHYRFRKAYVAQGHDLNDLPYRAKWFPFGPIFAFIICIVIIIGQGYDIFMSGGDIEWLGLIAVYIGVPLFLALWLGYKKVKKTKVIPLDKVDFSSRIKVK